jgi:hypothetical protein
MKIILTTICIFLCTGYNVFGQDTLYIYKLGSIVGKHALSDIDSITFSNPDNTIVNLQDTLFPPQGPVGGYNIDVDKDGVNDFNFYWEGSDGISISKHYTYITAMNNYEISTENITVEHRYYCGGIPMDTTFFDTLIPDIYITGDTIKSTTVFTTGKIFIAEQYHFYSMYTDCHNGYLYDNWKSNEIRYIAFRKVNETNTKIGWLKLKVLDYNYVILISYKIPENTGNMVIK